MKEKESGENVFYVVEGVITVERGNDGKEKYIFRSWDGNSKCGLKKETFDFLVQYRRVKEPPDMSTTDEREDAANEK